MSLFIPVSEVKETDIDIMEKKLTIDIISKKQRLSKKPRFGPIPTMSFASRRENSLVVPFHWGVRYFGKKYRPPREKCSSLSPHTRFLGTLRPAQEEIEKESMDLLNRHSSCLMAVYPGGGKCLGKGVEVLLSDGRVKKVENIRVGDCLAGDDNEPRRVFTICHGKESMFCVQRKGTSLLDYRVNRSHILTVWDTKEENIVDLPIVDVMKEVKRYHGVYFDHDGSLSLLRERRKSVLSWIQKHAWVVPNSMVDQIMLAGLWWEPSEKETHVRVFDPFGVLHHWDRRVYHTYELVIRPETNEDEYFGFEIDGNRRFLLKHGVCTHNTITSLSIASRIGLRTLIFVNKIVLIDQWIGAIRANYGQDARVHLVQSRKSVPRDMDFYVVNAINVMKHPFEMWDSMGIGCVIVDECHLMVTKILSQALAYVRPRYLLGLSATPFRVDGFDLLLELYFGLHRVVRSLLRPHRVHVIRTGIKIQHKVDARGGIQWNTVIDQQTSHETRNRLIVEICHRFRERNILILTKRISQIEDLQSLLSEDHVAVMKDNESVFDRSARILIATYQKVGTGFSHEKLDMLILACDSEEYFIQYLGRVFRRPDVVPVVIDLVDDHPILKRHFTSRKKIYQEAGGTIIEGLPHLLLTPVS